MDRVEMERIYRAYRRLLWKEDIEELYQLDEERKDHLVSYIMNKLEDTPESRRELIDEAMRHLEIEPVRR